MSKIQDAIRKLQSAQQVKRHSRRSVEQAMETKSIATVEQQSTDVLGGSLNDSGLVVNIDYDLLRKAGLLAPDAQQHRIADQYRLIKRPILNIASGQGAYQSDDANLIMIASPMPGDGKTFNCINLALSIATEKDKSVLLVDADVAKPHISRLFGVDNEPGLIDLLTDESLAVGDLLLRTNVPGLRLLPAGQSNEHATELLASKRMASIVETLSTTFPDRIVIFDSPALLLTSEAPVLASLMGQIVVVVCAGVTPRHAVLEAVEILDPEKAISLVLNKSGKGLDVDGYGGYGYGSRGAGDV